MFNMISYLGDLALGVIDKTGYAGVFILSMLESAAIPIPSEIVVPFSGFLATVGRFSFWLVVFVATTANLAGSIFLYWIGSKGGRWFLEKYGKMVFIHKHDLERGDKWFAKYGTKAIFFGRMLPVVRTFISLPAGVAGMNLSEFSLFTFLGSLPWNFFLAAIGYKAGEHWMVLHSYFRKLDILIVLLIGVLIAVYLWKHIRKKQ